MSQPPLPATVSANDLLKLLLVREKRARLNAEALAMQQANTLWRRQYLATEAEYATIQTHLTASYTLNGADEILEDGTIKRAAEQVLPAPNAPTGG